MIRSMDLEHSTGLMVEGISVPGKMESSMEEENTTWSQDKSDLENGSKEKE